jgi:hypothetical protein
MGDAGPYDKATIEARPCPESYLLPFTYKFDDSRRDFLREYVGYFTFAGPVSARVLLVPDFEGNAVQVIDVVSRELVGHVAAPGVVQGPRAVAAHGRLVAVIVGPMWEDPEVHVFEGEGTDWTPLWVIGAGIVTLSSGSFREDDREGDWSRPGSLCFTSDGTGIAVVSGCLSLFSMVDGAFIRNIAEDLGFYTGQVQECSDGWLVSGCYPPLIRSDGSFSRDSDAPAVGSGLNAGFALCRELGLLCTIQEGCSPSIGDERYARALVFATPEAVAMGVMSSARVAWMASVVRSQRA